MRVEKNYNLSKLNTFGISVNATFFVEIQSEADLAGLFKLPEFRENKKIFLGGGSNVLFVSDFNGIVVLNKLKGIEILKEDTESVLIKVMSGEVWHDLVIFAADQNYWGIENLSFIPGTVGAAPMQNIGAYGAELRHVLENVEAFDIETGERRIFNKEECELGYRDSVFKNKLKNKYFIIAITLTLSKKENKNLSYKILSDYLEKNNIEVKSPKDISDAVMTIRKSKLPDPKIIGNAGSFFKNIFVKKAELEKLQAIYPEMPHFEEDGVMKISAGWLIEQCGSASGTSWKGYRIGNVGVHDKQALVLVNHGGATGKEVLELSQNIIASVKEKFGLELVPEVNIV